MPAELPTKVIGTVELSPMGRTNKGHIWELNPADGKYYSEHSTDVYTAQMIETDLQRRNLIPYTP